MALEAAGGDRSRLNLLKPGLVLDSVGAEFVDVTIAADDKNCHHQKNQNQKETPVHTLLIVTLFRDPIVSGSRNPTSAKAFFHEIVS